MSAAPSGAAGPIARAEADGTITVGGGFKVDFSLGAFVAHANGKFRRDVGTGVYTATATNVPVATDGSFASDLSSPDIARAAIRGTLAHPVSPGQTIDIKLVCWTTFPPLNVHCRVVINLSP